MTHPTTAQREGLKNLPQQQQLKNLPQQENLQNIRQLFVSNYPLDNTAEEFEALFSRLGQVAEAYMKPSNRGGHQGYGFISYVDPQVAFRAVSYFNNAFVDLNWSPSVNGMVDISTAEPLFVRLSHEFKSQNTLPHDRRYEQRNIPQVNPQVVPQQQQIQQQFERNNENRQLFFYNVLYEINDQQLASFFSRFGPIRKLYLVPDPQHYHKGCGWITFSARQSTDDCYYYMRNSTVRMLNRKVYVDFAKRSRT